MLMQDISGSNFAGPKVSHIQLGITSYYREVIAACVRAL